MKRRSLPRLGASLNRSAVLFSSTMTCRQRAPLGARPKSQSTRFARHQSNTDKADVGALGPRFDAGDDALDSAPALGGIVELKTQLKLPCGRGQPIGSCGRCAASCPTGRLGELCSLIPCGGAWSKLLPVSGSSTP